MNIHPRKRFGQNFLRDELVLSKIILAINPQSSDHIIEIGPGLGALTTKILPLVNTLEAVELDKDLIPELQKNCENSSKLLIHQADAIHFNFGNCKKNKALRIVGNLPYNISTPLILHLLAQLDCIQDLHFMLQKEVGERLAATSGKAYGRLSVMVQYFCEVFPLFAVSPHAFYPIPKVDSIFVRLIPKKIINKTDITRLEQVVKLAFNQRRKTLSNSLRSILTAQQLEALNINPRLRAENLSLEDFVRISNAFV